jgi:nicotinate-nucleotide pyrophosphorylase (carboxylating)
MKSLDRVVKTALEEDLGSGDITSRLTLGPRSDSEGIILARQDGVLAGLPVVERVFLHLDPKVVVTAMIAEGDEFRSGQIVAELAGPTAAILAGERVALNLLQRLCGVATLTARFVKAVAGTGATVLDTRKTTPGLRELEKYAVRMGGGINHRMGLWDGILIKENHIHAAGGLTEAVARVRSGLRQDGSRYLVVVEAADERQVREAIDAGVDRILLDNMETDRIRRMVELVRSRTDPPVQLEASGGINLKNVREIAETGVDFVSIGALTHSVPAVDISLLLK